MVRKFLLPLILCLLSVVPALAQGPVLSSIIVVKDTSMANAYGLVSPVGSTNYVLNPSGEITGNFSAVSGATITRVTTYQKYGLYSYRVQTSAVGRGLQLTLSALTNSVHYVTFRIRNPNTKMNIVIGSATKPAVLIEKIDNNWSLYGASFSSAETSGQTAVQITVTEAGSKDFNIDGVQVEPLGYWTTYIDGTQEGCEWNGAKHASTSTRSSLSKAGGRVEDFFLDYGFFLERIIGGGDAGQSVNVDEYALLPGGEINSIKIHPRVFTLVGKFIADTEEELHEKRQALKLALDPSQYPGNQDTLIRFWGSRVQKEIAAQYQSGLEGDLAVFYSGSEPGEDTWTKVYKYTEKASIQFVAEDPFWYEVGESAALLDTNDSATFRTVAGRLRSTGQWDDLGPPHASGTYSAVHSMVEDETYIYIAGDFSNFNNIANADNIVRYNKATGVYSALSTGANGIVYDMALAADGTLYAVGDFTTIGGSAITRVASWDGSSWSDVDGVAPNGAVLAIVIGLDGKIYVTGNFAGDGRFISYDGSSWSLVGSGLTATGQALAVGIDGTIYVGGAFSDLDYIASWDGSTLATVGSGADAAVYSLAVGPTGILYAGGLFTTVPANKAAYWNGAEWFPMGSGANAVVSTLAIGPDGIIYAGGQFTEIGGVTLNDRAARWNGYTWSHLDIDLPGTPDVLAILPSKYVDPVVRQKYSLYLGFTTSGTGNYAGLVTAANEGTAPAFPDIHFTRSGGTTATIQTLRNEDNGQELLFNYSLLDGEELVISLYPQNRTIISGFFGSRLDAVLPNSNFGTWALPNGNSRITSFVSTSGSPTVTGWMLWRDAYKSYD